jgi:hypothetical protein
VFGVRLQAASDVTGRLEVIVATADVKRLILGCDELLIASLTPPEFQTPAAAAVDKRYSAAWAILEGVPSE